MLTMVRNASRKRPVRREDAKRFPNAGRGGWSR